MSAFLNVQLPQEALLKAPCTNENPTLYSKSILDFCPGVADTVANGAAAAADGEALVVAGAGAAAASAGTVVAGAGAVASSP